MRRVAITGLGCITPLGLDLAQTWDSLTRGRSAVAPFERIDVSWHPVRNAAIIKGFDPAAHLTSRNMTLMDTFSQMSVVSAREALDDSGLELTDALRARSAIVVGSGIGGMTTLEEGFKRFYTGSRRRAHPLIIPKVMANAGASHISMVLGLTGPAYTISTACSSANHAIGEALWMIRSGRADMAITGGAEAMLTPASFASWVALRVMSPDTIRPFSKDRSGMILGEGAAIAILEPLDAAKARGARIYAELAGAGQSSDAGDIVLPKVEGPAAAMTAALADAGMAAGQIDYISAHGTGTAANDVIETRAIRAVFGAAADRLMVSSTKSMHGHALGASGAFELVATAKAVETGVIPPTANFNEPDPECDLDVVPNQAREVPIKAALSNSFAFGGLNAVLALRKVE